MKNLLLLCCKSSSNGTYGIRVQLFRHCCSSGIRIFDLLDMRRRSENDWDALMHLLRGDVQDALRSRGSLAACLFEEEGHRRCLVHKAQFAVRALRIRRVREETTVEECAVNIRNHGADVSRGERLLGSPLSNPPGFHRLAEGLIP